MDTQEGKPSIEQVLLNIAVELNMGEPSTQQYQKLIDVLQHLLPCDASALFTLDNERHLVPIAMNGLSLEVFGRRFLPDVHPRLAMT